MLLGCKATENLDVIMIRVLQCSWPHSAYQFRRETSLKFQANEIFELL